MRSTLLALLLLSSGCGLYRSLAGGTAQWEVRCDENEATTEMHCVLRHHYNYFGATFDRSQEGVWTGPRFLMVHKWPTSELLPVVRVDDGKPITFTRGVNDSEVLRAVLAGHTAKLMGYMWPYRDQNIETRDLAGFAQMYGELLRQARAKGYAGTPDPAEPVIATAH